MFLLQQFHLRKFVSSNKFPSPMSQFLFQPEKIQDSRTGISQICSNIHICESIADCLATTLGPYGLDKLFYGKKLLLTNDGATIMENLNFKHPVSKILASVSKSQDNEVGDGTTSVVLLTSSILSNLKPLLKEKFSVEVILKVFKETKLACLEKIESLKIEANDENILKLGETSLNSKNVRNYKSHFSKLLFEGLKHEDDLTIEKIPGGSIEDSFLAKGISFEKTFTYAGYEQQPKKIINPLICCLNVELEWKSERDNSEVKISSVEEYQKVVDAEWAIIKNKLEDIVNSGANIVLSSLPIGDFATQFFASKGIFSAGRVKNLENIVKAFHGKISNSTKYIKLGSCESFEEIQIGKSRYNSFEGKNANSHTLILRGPGEEILEEIERSVHDAICVMRMAIKRRGLVCGGGSVEMQLSKLCREIAFTKANEEMFVLQAISKSLEKIPAQLSSNFGLDAVHIIQSLRKLHITNPFAGVTFSGVDDMSLHGIYESVEAKKNMIKAAFNAAEAIILIDSTLVSKN